MSAGGAHAGVAAADTLAAPPPSAETVARAERRAWYASRAAIALLAALVGLLSVVPFILVFAISFGEKIEGESWIWAFDTANYARFFLGIEWPEDISFLYVRKLYYSLYFAGIAAVLAMVLAFPFAYLMTRQGRRAQTIWLVVLLSSVSLSEVFVAMGWDILLSNRSGLPMVFRETGLTALLKDIGVFGQLRDWGLATPRNVRFKPSELATILTLTYLVWPYAVILLYPPLSRLDNATLEAARTMGAGPWTVVRTVVIPSVRVPILGSTLLLFVFLLGIYVVVTVFTDPAKQTLAISIYQAIRGATLNAPFGAAQAVVLLVTAALFLGASSALSRLAETRR
jgi:putative spermidine/putrescine transport system permease protein